MDKEMLNVSLYTKDIIEKQANEIIDQNKKIDQMKKEIERLQKQIPKQKKINEGKPLQFSSFWTNKPLGYSRRTHARSRAIIKRWGGQEAIDHLGPIPPNGWTVQRSRKNQDWYFHNPKTGESCWADHLLLP